jgi:serine protease
VRYGANGTFVQQTATNSISCTNATFGDPIPGVVKHCDYSGSP